MQWPLTSQLHGSVSQREQLVIRYGSNSTPLRCKKFTTPQLQSLLYFEKENIFFNGDKTL
jgi:hypothetical protein